VVVGLPGSSDPAANPADKGEHLQPLRVLLVDNSRLFLSAAAQFLASVLGLEVVEQVLSMRAALAKVLELRPHLVLLDLETPDMNGFLATLHLKALPDAPWVIIVSDQDQPPYRDLAKAVQVDGFVTKRNFATEVVPVIRQLAAKHERGQVAAAAPAALQGSWSRQPGAPESKASAGHKGQVLRILLAEDNSINQTVAVHVLEKQGHTVAVAGNGEEALTALAQGTFDLVLMDVEMPVMGGFEATAAIRAQEQATRKHLPILAMTAHAMKGDRERCLAAGMDGYVSKPLQIQELWRVIAEAVPASSAGEIETPPSPTTDAVLNGAAVLHRVGNNLTVLRKLIALFNNECPKLMGAIRAALSQKNAKDLETAAHTLKGAVGNLGAVRAFRAARQLESAGGDWTVAAESFAALEKEIDGFQAALVQLGQVEQP
jgi:CheY-like chemotaxis protein